MRKPAPGNRLVVGDSGIVFELPEGVASGLVGNKTARYVGEPVPTAPARPEPETESEPEGEHEVPTVPKRRGRPPKATTVEDSPEL